MPPGDGGPGGRREARPPPWAPPAKSCACARRARPHDQPAQAVQDWVSTRSSRCPASSTTATGTVTVSDPPSIPGCSGVRREHNRSRGDRFRTPTSAIPHSWNPGTTCGRWGFGGHRSSTQRLAGEHSRVGKLDDIRDVMWATAPRHSYLCTVRLPRSSSAASHAGDRRPRREDDVVEARPDA